MFDSTLQHPSRPEPELWQTIAARIRRGRASNETDLQAMLARVECPGCGATDCTAVWLFVQGYVCEHCAPVAPNARIESARAA